MAGRLEGKVTIITGAARGMGESTARLFSKEGAKVVLTDVMTDLGGNVAKDIGGDSVFMELDVSSDQNWADVIGAVKDKLGTIDALINNAGLVHFTPIEHRRSIAHTTNTRAWTGRGKDGRWKIPETSQLRQLHGAGPCQGRRVDDGQRDLHRAHGRVPV